MKRSLWLGFMAGAALMLWPWRPNAQEPAPSADALPLWAAAVANYRQLEPGTPAAAEKARQILALKEKAFRPRVPAENPEPFWQALKRLKTRPDGRTYVTGYQIHEQTAAKTRRKKAGQPRDWVSRGPGNVSGRTRALVVDPDDPSGGTWFAATVGGGIWKTTDGGNNWQNKTPQLSVLSTTCLAMAASNPNILYAGTGMGYGRIVDLAGAGVWKSTDRGESWTQLASTANGQVLQAVNRIVVDPQNPDVVLLCSNDTYSHLGPKGGQRRSGIFRSTDGGASWAQVFDSDAVFGTNSDNRVQQIIAEPGNFNNLYAAVNEVGVIRSTNGGLTWTPSAVNFALPSDVGNPPSNGFGLAGISVRTELAIAPSDPARIYAAVERPRGVADLYMSANRGASWVLLNDTGNDPNWFNSSGRSGASGAYVAGWFDNTIVVSPYDPNLVFVGGVNLYRIQVNPGANNRTAVPIAWWIPTQSGLPVVHADHHFLVAIPQNQSTGNFWLLDANDGGMAVSLDRGNSWRQITGMVTTQFYGVDKKPGENVYIGGMQDNGTWRSGTDPNPLSPWTFQTGGDGVEVAWHAENPNLLLAGSQFGRLRRSNNGGASWNTVSGLNLGNAPFITKIASSKIDPDLVLTIGSNGVMRSDDFGLTWTQTAINGNWLGFRPFDNVEISESSPDIVWISSSIAPGPVSGIRGGVHVSRDAGLSFTHVSGNIPFALGEPSGLATHPLEPETAFLLFAAPGLPKVLRTKDLGQTWEDFSGFAAGGMQGNGFPDVAVFSLLVLPHNPDLIWAGTEIGLFESEDGGASWQFADDGLPQVAIFQMRIVEGQILLATQGRGIYTLDLPELAGFKPPGQALAPRLSRLAQHPNGNILVQLDQRSAYDETQVFINNKLYDTLPANGEAASKTLFYPWQGEPLLSMYLAAKSGNKTLRSAPKTLFPFARDALTQYVSDLNQPTASADFNGGGFSLVTPQGFSSQAIHTAHPYANNSELTFTLRSPLIVPSDNATLSYDDVALVEPGSGNGQFGNPLFFDYVIVEATRDGVTWQPLLDGYDARFDSRWLAAFNNGTSGNENMMVRHTVDLLQFFDPGERIFVRFRLSADAGANGWGWAIDNLSIFPNSGSNPQAARQLVYPWLSNNSGFQSLLVANNPANTPAEVRFRAWRETGFFEETASFSIPARGFLARNTRLLFPNLAEGRGYAALLETSSAAVQGRWVTFNTTSATGKSPSQGVALEVEPGAAAQDLVFGYLPGSNGFISSPVVINTGTMPADIDLTFFQTDGEQVGNAQIEGLEPGRPFARIVADLIPDPAQDVYMVARSAGQPLNGLVFVFNSQGETAIGNAVTRPATAADRSHLLYSWVSNNADFESVIVANNPGSQPVTVTLTATRGDGMTEAVTRDIPASGFLSAAAASLFPGLGQGRGYAVQLTSASPGLEGRWVTNDLTAASGASPSQGVAVDLTRPQDPQNTLLGTSVLFGYLPGDEGFQSAPVIVNTGPGPANVTLYFYAEDGRLIATDSSSLASLPPYQPFAAPIANLVPAGIGAVSLVAQSNGPAITGVAFVFNDGGEPAIGNVQAVDFEP